MMTEILQACSGAARWAVLVLLLFAWPAQADGDVSATWQRAEVALPAPLFGPRPVLGLWADQEVQQSLAAVPAGSRLPAALVLHGCSGFGIEETNAKLFLVASGYPVFMPDSFARRGRQSNCAVRTGATGFAPGAPYLRLEEIDYALAAIARLGFVDRVFLVGLSEGGLAVAAVDRSPLPLAGIVVLSWHCQGREPYQGIKAPADVPVLTLIGDSDPWYQAMAGRHCGEVFGRRADARSLVLPGNGHPVFTSPIAVNQAQAMDAIRAFLQRN